MKKYEGVVLIKSDLDEKETKNIIDKITNKMKEYVDVTDIEDLGVRKLAYEVRKNKYAHYLVYQFEKEEIKNNEILEIERFYRITDEVIKYMIVRKD